MIRDQLNYNETAAPNSYELELLKEIFPQYFDHVGNFMKQKFSDMLKADEVGISEESYGLKFLGRNYGNYLAGLQPTTVLVPDEEHNARAENKNSRNLYLVGDNLDVLKHLTYSYTGAVKCIYIDPPYNTGGDGFEYVDNFGYTVEELVEKVGLDREEARRTIDLQGKATHSAWLTMMLPRLVVAKELLTDDGAIFISIDDNEQANLQLLCNDIFGESSYLGTFIVDKGNSKSDKGDVQKNHEYVLCYGRSGLYHKSKKRRKIYEDQGRYFYLLDPITTRGEGGVLNRRQSLGYTFYWNSNSNELIPVHDYDEIAALEVNADDSIYSDRTDLIERGFIPIRPPRVRDQLGAWTWDLPRALKHVDDLYVKETRDGFNVYKRAFVDAKDVESTEAGLFYEQEALASAKSLIKLNSTDGATRVRNLIGADIFQNPKNTTMLKTLIQLLVEDGDIVLDFFSGSASTADAVMQINAERGGHRSYIMVQLPEPVRAGRMAAHAGYETIDEIGRERIRRAAQKISEDNDVLIDAGFKLFYSQPPEKPGLDSLETFDPSESALFSEDMVTAFGTEKASGRNVISTTWLNRDGFGLNVEYDSITLHQYQLQVYKHTAYIIDPGMTSEDVIELVRLIENNDLKIARLVYYPYSVEFNILHELEQNLQNLRSDKTIKRIARH